MSVKTKVTMPDGSSRCTSHDHPPRRDPPSTTAGAEGAGLARASVREWPLSEAFAQEVYGSVMRDVLVIWSVRRR